MIDLLVAAINKPKNKREERRILNGTPPKTFRSPAIGANGIWVENFDDDPDLDKYTPLDTAVVSNQSASNITFYKNENSNDFTDIASNSKLVIPADGLRSMKIYERDGAAIAEGKIQVTVSRAAVSLDEMRRNTIQKIWRK